MGLDTTHDCWHGAYSAFHRWRVRVAQLIGVDLDEMRGFGGDRSWDTVDSPLVTLLNHSDCDGEIVVGDCEPIADALEALLPAMANMRDGGGHIGAWVDKTQQFIDGLRAALAAGENVEFH